MDTEMFGTMPLGKLFLRCVIPSIITSVFGALYSIEDGIIVGRYLGEDALAAINLIMPVIMIVEALSNMIATGTAVNMSILLGQKKREEASRVFSFSVKFIILFSCILSYAAYFYARSFIMLISPGASEEAIRLSVEYLKIYAIFGPLIPIYFATDNYLRVCGKEKTSMIIAVLTQGLNIVIDIILIVILHYGVKAAALSSCISMALGSIITLYMFSGRRMDVYYTKENIPLSQFLHIASNGASEFFSTIATSIMSLIMNLFLLKYGGTTAVAAFSVVMYVDSVIGMMNFGICDSLQPVISYCYGAGLIERMKSVLRMILSATISISILAFLSMYLAGPYTATFFIKADDTSLMEMSISAIKIFSFSYLVGWIDMCFSSFFTALDKPLYSLITSLFGTLIFPIVFLFILTSIWGLKGVWMMSAFSGAASGLLTFYLFRKMKFEQNPPMEDISCEQ